MVKLHIKKGDESQFLYETTVEQPIDELVKDVCAIHNGRLKVQRICAGNFKVKHLSSVCQLIHSMNVLLHGFMLCSRVSCTALTSRNTYVVGF